MKRLPTEFEEILKTHNIEWDLDCYAKVTEDGAYAVHGGYYDKFDEVSKYELTGIALETNKYIDVVWSENRGEWYATYYQSYIDKFSNYLDEDFCECIFKAMRDVYK